MTELLHPDSISADFVPNRRESFVSVEIEGEGLLLDEDRGTWHFLNPMAQVIWSCCDGTGPIDEIARDISEVYSEAYDTVLNGVLDTVRQFGHQGLLAGVDQTSAGGHAERDDEHGFEDAIEAGNKPRFLPVPPSS